MIRIAIVLIMIIGLIIFLQSCQQSPPPPQSPMGYDVKAGAGKYIRINADELLIQPYAPYIKVQVRYNDNPEPQQSVYWQIKDCNDQWSIELCEETSAYQDLNPAGQIAQEEGFVVWDRLYSYQNLCSVPDRFHVSYALRLGENETVPEGQKWGSSFEITVIDDHEGSDVPNNEFTHQRDTQGVEVPGDGFHDAGDPDYNDVYGALLDPVRKDLFIEFDYPTTNTWITNNLSGIITNLETMFNTAGVKIHVFSQTIDNVVQNMTRDQIKARLHNDRDLTFQRRALHIVVLSEMQGQPLLLGECIQLQGNPPMGDGKWDYECFDEVYDTQRGIGYGALDSVGCVIFWEVFDRTNLGAGWAELDAFSRVVAHEIGHALGIYNTYSRLEGVDNVGCIMDDVDPDNRIDRPILDRSMEFYQANVDNVVPNLNKPFSSAFNLRDIMGVNTTSIKSGNPYSDNINP